MARHSAPVKAGHSAAAAPPSMQIHFAFIAVSVIRQSLGRANEHNPYWGALTRCASIGAPQRARRRDRPSVAGLPATTSSQENDTWESWALLERSSSASSSASSRDSSTQEPYRWDSC